MTYNYKKIFEKIANLRLDDTYDLNAGGCGLFATMMASWFPELDIIYKWPEDYNIDNGIPSGCSHVVLYDGKTYYDSEGVYTRIDKDTHKRKVSLRYAYISANRASEWNNCFNRSNMNIIRENVHKIVCEYKKVPLYPVILEEEKEEKNEIRIRFNLFKNIKTQWRSLKLNLNL